jgi:PAS domain S-box-containing protein
VDLATRGIGLKREAPSSQAYHTGSDTDRAADSERRFRAAVDAVQGILWTNDAVGRMTGEQPGWAALTGQSYEEYQGHGWADAVHPEDARVTIEAWRAAVAEKRTFVFEHRVRRRDGAWRLFSIRAVPTFDSEGRLREWVGVHTDITDQRTAERALRDLMATLELRVQTAIADVERSESRFRAIFQTSYQYKGIAALDGTVLDANPTSLKGIGASLSDVVGKPLWETPWFTGTPGVAQAVCNAVAAVAKGETIRKEARIALPAGERWFDFTMRPIRDARGEVVAIVPEAADITARRQVEDALRQSQKLEAIGQLTGGIAHDFNNLLTPIVGGLDLLQRKQLGDAQTGRLISAALQSAERARTLVQRLLSFARRQHLDARPVNLRQLVDGMLELIGRPLGPKIEVRIDMADGLPDARVDPNQLEVALLNLAVNARDAMPEGGVISISGRAADVAEAQGAALSPGRYVRLSLADTGAGMPPETLARAVEPFFSTKCVGKGTGLGLSMVHGLAAQSGGQLQLESAPGKGTTATLWLPAVEPAPVRKGGASADSIPRGRSLAVLLVDDDDLVRAGAAAMLEDLGHTVVQASSGVRALEYLVSGEACDVLVTDQRMPCMTGVELFMRATALRPGLPAVLISGFSDPAAGAEGLPHLAKPFRAADLARAISQAAGADP